MIVNTDPQTGERDHRVLKAAGREHDTCAGVYGAVVEPGLVSAGDPVVLS